MSWLPESQWPIQQMRDADLYFYLQSTNEYVSGHHVDVEDHGVMQLFGSYSYLGLIGHPKINAAAKNAIERFGTGTHGVRLLSGTLEVHRQLEARIARFKQTESAAVFSSGYLCNFSSIAALIGREDFIFADMLIHASLLDGCLKSGAEVVRFRHNDPAHLRKSLQAAPSSGRKLVVIDAVYSMDGDIADLPAISTIAHEHGAWLMVDEAHSIGVLGATGHGIEEHFGLPSDSIDIKMGTLSKCIPSCGGYIAGSSKLCDFLRHQSRGFIYSGAIPPSVAAAALAAFDVIEDEPHRIQQLHSNINWFASRLRENDIPYMNSQTAIFPIICGKDERAFALARFMQKSGFYVQAIPYPVVPPEMARLRVSITSEHCEADMQGFISALIAGIDSVGGMCS